MNRFAFIIHPLEACDVARKYAVTRILPPRFVESLVRLMPPVVASHISGIRSRYAEAEGWFIAVPLTASQFLSLPEEYVLRRIIKAGRIAERLGAQILGLGAFTSVVADAGITVSRNLSIPVTTGNSYTVATAIEGTKEAARLMGIDLKEAAACIVGATGSIGSACAVLLGREVKDLVLVGRNEVRLDVIARRIVESCGIAPTVTTDVRRGLADADIVIAVSSAVDVIIEPEFLKRGAVVCDVARPRNVSRLVAEHRSDVLVIEGGVVEVPGNPDFGIDFGFPPGMAMACMAETMILALEGRFESYTLGREISVRQVDEMRRLAEKHGFRLAGLRSFERALTREEIEKIKAAAFSRLGAGELTTEAAGRIY